MLNKISTRLFFNLAIFITQLISGAMTALHTNEFYNVKIRRQYSGYPFGGEGPAPYYYYKTAALYATTQLIWGLVFLLVLLVTARVAIKKQKRNSLLLPSITIFLVLLELIQGQIST